MQNLYKGMPMRKLGRSDLVVSRVGLGTLTFGEQVTEADTVELLDKATKEYGINLIVSELNCFFFLFEKFS